MACPETDNGKNAASATAEKADNRVNINTSRVLGKNGKRFWQSLRVDQHWAHVLNVSLEKSAWSSSQSTARREGSRPGLGPVIGGVDATTGGVTSELNTMRTPAIGAEDEVKRIRDSGRRDEKDAYWRCGRKYSSKGSRTGYTTTLN